MFSDRIKPSFKLVVPLTFQLIVLTAVLSQLSLQSLQISHLQIVFSLLLSVQLDRLQGGCLILERLRQLLDSLLDLVQVPGQNLDFRVAERVRDLSVFNEELDALGWVHRQQLLPLSDGDGGGKLRVHAFDHRRLKVFSHTDIVLLAKSLMGHAFQSFFPTTLELLVTAVLLLILLVLLP